MSITGTLVQYYHVCKRRCWLHANNIRMEHTSDTVAEGKLLHETSYPQRAAKYTEIMLGGSKIDFYDAQNKVIHETKKSDKMEAAHEWQLKYYLLLLEEEAGVTGATGRLEYPKLRETKEITLSDEDKIYLKNCCAAIEKLIALENCPPRIDKPMCKKCSYYELCYVED